MWEGGRIVFGKKVVGVEAESGRVQFEDGEEAVVDVVIGADGIRGKSRGWIPENEGI